MSAGPFSGYFLSVFSKSCSDQFLLCLTVTVVATVYQVILTRGSYWRGVVVSPGCLQVRCEKVGSESLSNFIGVGSVSVGVNQNTLTVEGRSPVLGGSQHSHPVQSWSGPSHLVPGPLSLPVLPLLTFQLDSSNTQYRIRVSRL